MTFSRSSWHWQGRGFHAEKMRQNMERREIQGSYESISGEQGPLGDRKSPSSRQIFAPRQTNHQRSAFYAVLLTWQNSKRCPLPKAEGLEVRAGPVGLLVPVAIEAVIAATAGQNSRAARKGWTTARRGWPRPGGFEAPAAVPPNPAQSWNRRHHLPPV